MLEYIETGRLRSKNISLKTNVRLSTEQGDEGKATLEEVKELFNSTTEVIDRSKYLISGGAEWSGTDYVYDVSNLHYFWSTEQTIESQQIILTESDPDYDRIDAVVITEGGIVSVLEGIPAENPLTPEIHSHELLVQYIIVEANTTQPTVNQEIIYQENAEWTISKYQTSVVADGTVDAEYTTLPKGGVNCISADVLLRQSGIKAQRIGAIDINTYNVFAIWVKLKTVVATNKSLVARFYNSNTAVGVGINLLNHGIVRTNLNVWQLAVVPVSLFSALSEVDNLRIIMSGGSGVNSYDVDNVILSDGSAPITQETKLVVQEAGITRGLTDRLNFTNATVTRNAQGGFDVTTAEGGGATQVFSDVHLITEADLDVNHKYFLQDSDIGKLIVLFIGDIAYDDAVVDISPSGLGVSPDDNGRFIGFNIANYGAGIVRTNSGTAVTIKTMPMTKGFGLSNVNNTFDAVSSELLLFGLIAGNGVNTVQLLPLNTAIVANAQRAYTMQNFLTPNITKVATITNIDLNTNSGNLNTVLNYTVNIPAHEILEEVYLKVNQALSNGQAGVFRVSATITISNVGGFSYTFEFQHVDNIASLLQTGVYILANQELFGTQVAKKLTAFTDMEIVFTMTVDGVASINPAGWQTGGEIEIHTKTRTTLLI